MPERILFGRSLLPSSATSLMRCLSEAAAEAAERLPGGATVPDVLSWERCPSPLLAFLAWEWSVDEWVPTWPEAQKRYAVAASWDVHRVKGTVYAIERAVDVLGLGASVREWWSYGGQPYTFRLSVESAPGRAWGPADYAQIYRVALRAKNVRSYLEPLRLRTPGPAVPVYVSAVVRSRIRVRPSTEPVTRLAAQPPVFVGAVVRTRLRVKPCEAA